MANCWKHGDYEGWECPTCAQTEATRKAGEEAAEAAREAGEQTAEATREAANRAAEATYAAAFESRIEAAIQHEEALEAQRETVRQHAQLARDGWKLEVQSKVQRGLELLNNKMPSEASAVLGNAIATDPANMYGHLYLALSHLLMGKGNGEESPRHRKLWVAHLTKAVQLLGTSDYSDLHAHAEVARCFWIPDDDERGLPETPAKALLHQKISTYISPFSVDELFVDEDRCFLKTLWMRAGRSSLPQLWKAFNQIFCERTTSRQHWSREPPIPQLSRQHESGNMALIPGSREMFDGWKVLCAPTKSNRRPAWEPLRTACRQSNSGTLTRRRLYSNDCSAIPRPCRNWFRRRRGQPKGDLLDLYDRLRVALYGRLDRLASERAPKDSKYGLGTGCGLAVGVSFFGFLLGVLVTLPQTNPRAAEETFTLFGCSSLVLAPLLALVLVSILNASYRREKLEEAVREARVGQQRLEIAIGYGGSSTAVASDHPVLSPVV